MARTFLNRAAANRPFSELARDYDVSTSGTYGAVSVIRSHLDASVMMTTPMHKLYVGSPARLEHSGAVHRAEVLIAPAGTTHRMLGASEQPMVVAYLDPRRFRWADVERLAQRVRKFVPGHDDPTELYADAHKIPAPRLDQRVEAAVSLLGSGASVAEIAQKLGLSESRLSHLFSERLGTPLRAWRSWLLLRSGMLEVLSGSSFTEAAHAAGFADAAHMSRTHRKLLGLTPTQLAHFRSRFMTPSMSALDCDALRASGRTPRAVAGTIRSALGR